MTESAERPIRREHTFPPLSDEQKWAINFFRSGPSDHLRNRLSAVFGGVGLLLMDHPELEELREIDGVNKGVKRNFFDREDRLYGLVNRKEIKKEPVSSEELIWSLEQLKNEGAAMTFESEAKGEVLIDRSLVNLAVAELIDNAQTSMKRKKGEEAIRVTLGGRMGEGFKISICDKGMGISEGLAAKLTAVEGFVKDSADSTELFPGSGFGLLIARRVTELHGGSLSFQSEGIGKGATFTLNLP